MAEPLLEIPAGGWTVDDVDAFAESNRRYELTDGALTVSPFACDVAIAERLPRWAGRSEGPTVPKQGFRCAPHRVPRRRRIGRRPGRRWTGR
jgi:hypothetical protein